MPKKATPEMIAGRRRREAEEQARAQQHNTDESEDVEDESSEEEDERVDTLQGKYCTILDHQSLKTHRVVLNPTVVNTTTRRWTWRLPRSSE